MLADVRRLWLPGLVRPRVTIMNELICPNCQSLNRPGAIFCAICGRGLEHAIPVALDDAPTAPRIQSGHQAEPIEEGETVQMRRNLGLRVGHRTDVGRSRSSNEDSLLALDFTLSNKSVDEPAGLFVVADGMGGHEGGEIASGMLVRAVARQAAAEWLPRLTLPDEEPGDGGQWLVGAIQAGNREIYDWARDTGLAMGTTVVAALLMGQRAAVAHVGDSRAYRIGPTFIERLTADHSLVESLVVANQISREEARDHPQSNVIYRTIGDRREVAVDLREVTLAAGESLLLCSDGLSGMLTDEAIHQTVIAAAAPQAACEALIDAANRAGGEDNVTVILVTAMPSGR